MHRASVLPSKAMQKAYLMMLLFMSVAIPMRLASRTSSTKAARKTVWHILAFLLVWSFGIRFLYFHL
jgi:hypothetical protein